MSAGEQFARFAGAAGRRPLLTLALLSALALGCAIAALGLRPTAATNTLVGSSSSTYRETQRFYESFGEEPIEVLVQGNLRKLVLSSDIGRLLGLEGCLSGNVPAAGLPQEGGTNGPCGQLARAKTVKVVFGPGTFLNEAAQQVDSALLARSKQAETEAARAASAVYARALAHGLGTAQASTLAGEARKATMAGYAAEISALAIRYGIHSAPSLENHEFVSAVVFDPTKPAGTPKQRFAYLFPNSNAALVTVRLRAGLTEAQRNRTIALIHAAVAMPQWHLENGETYLVTGEPVIVSELTGAISRSIELLLVAVLAVMALALSLVFRRRPRLLPLAVALLAVALAFGALALSGASLTMASIAVLPVLVGLSVDYAIQFQSRVAEALAECAPPPAHGDGPHAAAGPASAAPADVLAAVRLAAARGVPTIATAALASIGGLLVLLLSPVPMVRGFGLLLVVGVVFALVCALSAGSAALVLAARRSARGTPGSPRDPARAVASEGAAQRMVAGDAVRDAFASLRAQLTLAWQGARELLADNPATRLLQRLALQRAVRQPGRVLAIGLALAALGWGLDTQTQVQTDIAKLAPQSLSSLHNLSALEAATGVGGEIDLTVSSHALLAPRTVEWMSRYENAVLTRFGYSSAHGCTRAQLCPAFSLPDLFEEEEGKPAKLSARTIDGVIDGIPRYFSEDVISPDRRLATLAFGIRLMSLQQQNAVIEGMRAQLHPPAGVSAHLVGLSVLAAQAGAQLASPWRRVEMLLLALAAVAAILLVLFRGDRRRALLPLAPVTLATGWSALVLFALQIPLNPMSVTLGTLVIAISTEFSVLLCERFRQERLAGLASAPALRRAYRHTGAAVAASGVTAIAGFGVLALSEIAMLRDFGLVTLVDLSVSLVGVLIALPAAIALVEGERPLTQLVRDGARALATS